MIKEKYIEILGTVIWPQIEKAIDNEGWYSNERNDQWLPIAPHNIHKFDYRNENTEIRPIALREWQKKD